MPYLILQLGKFSRSLQETVYYRSKTCPESSNTQPKSRLKMHKARSSVFVPSPKLKNSCDIPLFRNKGLALNKMFQQNASKFAIFYV